MFCTNCGEELGSGQKFCTACGDVQHGQKVYKKNHNKKITFLGLAIFIIVSVSTGYFFYNSKSPSYEVAASIVNIYCESDYNDASSGGSGTIFTEDGTILTNAHIIPINTETGLIDEESTCLVVLPDPQTGSPDELYWGYPIIDPEFSDIYDIAFIQIHDVFYDSEEDITYGDYPKKFPYYTDDNCKKENVKLGEPVRIYGYPALSGGYTLTVTDGVVSSLLLDEGLIVTSAKISHGNSGGIAVDQYGCMLGIPSMVLGDEYESLGVIISTDLIVEFASEFTQ